jgi:hypothetical protein
MSALHEIEAFIEREPGPGVLGLGVSGLVAGGSRLGLPLDLVARLVGQGPEQSAELGVRWRRKKKSRPDRRQRQPPNTRARHALLPCCPGSAVVIGMGQRMQPRRRRLSRAIKQIG